MADTISLDKVVTPGIKEHFVGGYKQLQLNITELLGRGVGTQTNKTDTYQNYAEIGGFSEVGEGQDFDEDSPIEAYGTTITPVKFGKMIGVTYELRKWAETKKIWDAAFMLGQKAAKHVHKSAASLYINGFSTAYTSMTDGKPFFSTQHLRADGGASQSNCSATGADLSDENLEVGLLALEFQKDDRGDLISVMGTRLLVPSALRKLALQITKSEKVADSAENATNVYKLQKYYGTIEVLVWPYLAAAAGGSDTMWVLEDTSYVNMKWSWADKPQVLRDDSIGFKRQTAYYLGFYYAGKGWKDWRGKWGSKGDSQAYSS